MDKPFAITLDVGSSLANKTGSWRTFRPEYLDRMPPCNHQCPAGENIQAWLYHAEEGRYEDAWRKIMEENPFPAVMGRICYHTCESACNRGKVDESVGINGVERFLGDQAIKYDWKVAAGKPTGKKVLVVGAGPGGLTCAYHLARFGHQATVLDAAPKAGGMVRYGIPKYRMPREKLNAEIQRIADMGVQIRLNTRVDDLADEMKKGGYDAAFVATGAQLGRMVGLPGGGKLPVLDAVKILRQLELEEPVPLRGRVMVYGGGNTAFDVARSAVRLGAIEALVVYRRTRDKMPAHPSEIKEALEEGVTLRCLSTITAVGESSITVEKMELDDKGNPQPTGELETLTATSLVLALGTGCGPRVPREGVGPRDRRRRGDGRTQHGDRRAGRIRGRRHGALGPQCDRGNRSRQEGGTAHRCLPARRNAAAPAQARNRHARQDELLVLLGRPALDPTHTRSGATHLRVCRGGGRFRRSHGALRSAPLPVVRQLLRMRQLLRRVPGQRGD